MGNLQNRQDKESTGFWKDFRNYFREYCQCSSIHGFRYFGEKRTVFERVWWFFVFMACLTGCVFSIYLVYKKWDQSPVIVSFATRGTPIYKIPFPAVTICPESKMVQSLFNWTDVISRKSNAQSITGDQEKKYQYMKLLCNSKYIEKDDDTFSDNFYEVLDEIFPKTIDRMFDCKFMNLESVDCSKIFTPIITDVGICYSFNILDRKDIFREHVQQYKDFHTPSFKNHSDWTIQEGYSPNSGIDPYPHRALLAGAKSALELKLVTLKADIDYACTDSVPVQGYRVILHTGSRIPRPSHQYFRVPLDQVVSASVQPAMITTSDSVKLYNPRRRQCFFPSERYLRYFKTYTSLNCQLECLTNHTLASCGCVNFFMPKENGTKICGPGNKKCMKFAEDVMHFGHLNQKINEKPGSASSVKDECDCKPICSDLTYDAVTSQTHYDWRNNFKALGLPYNISEDHVHITGLIVYFKSDNFITSERNELYGPTDFLANFGGLLGLFTGFSVLSLMEILYFMSVRLICNSRLYGYWAGPDRT